MGRREIEERRKRGSGEERDRGEKGREEVGNTLSTSRDYIPVSHGS